MLFSFLFIGLFISWHQREFEYLDTFITPHISDVMGVIVLTSSVCLSLCPSHSTSRMDGHTDLIPFSIDLLKGKNNFFIFSGFCGWDYYAWHPKGHTRTIHSRTDILVTCLSRCCSYVLCTVCTTTH